MDLSPVRNRPSLRVECSQRRWAMVLGGADCVWQDIQWYDEFTFGQWPGLVIAANDIGCHVPTLDHWVSFHVNKFDEWRRRRAENGLPPGFATWGWKHDQPVNWAVHAWAAGSSGMLAAQVALELGCTKVLLCGIPMTQRAHFAESKEFNSETTVWSESDLHWRSWLRVHELGLFEDRVRSVSGRTRDLFGEPNLEWLFV